MFRVQEGPRRELSGSLLSPSGNAAPAVRQSGAPPSTAGLGSTAPSSQRTASDDDHVRRPSIRSIYSKSGPAPSALKTTRHRVLIQTHRVSGMGFALYTVKRMIGQVS